MKFGIVVFPGSNCEHDNYYVLNKVVGAKVEYIWHKETALNFFDVIILPGGFTYGDYLRVGAVARFSPVMKEVVKFANSGGPVLGICNGFQILLEAGLLPGSLITNDHLRFRCQDVYIKVVNNKSCFTKCYETNQVLKMPIAHYSGNYFADKETIENLEREDRILFQYCSSDGDVVPEANPNGSMLNIAGILNEKKNVLGMMPHPERAAEKILGSEDGLGIFNSLLGKN
ncbi:MAG: phosphoribosylformylglycinamidine synthase I [Candidatus Neomarinimicrobiota bacterium]|nr:MAG: phosphoribosylformylglycinamidine synthase I [Candidatus Neomarinimicrobiota bacterium]